MKLAVDILKSLLLPKLEKDSNFDADKTNELFWETFAKALLDFEKDAKPVYGTIYSLKLNDSEKIISQLQGIYASYLNELAEQHVLGTSSEMIDYLLDSENKIFAQQVHFFSSLKEAIKKVERKRIKSELPKAYEKLTFELSDSVIESAVKKKEREALKDKMKMWDAEIEEEQAPKIDTITLSDYDKEPKVISLSWLKYAVASCLVVGLGIWFYQNQNQAIVPSNTVVTAPDKNQPVPKIEVVPEIPLEALAEVSITSKSSNVIEESGLGYANKTQKVTINENSQEARITSIVKAIEKYRVQLEKEFAEHKNGYTFIGKELQNRVNSLKKELKTLNERERKYTFDGKILTMYVLSVQKEENRILLYNDVYYLKKDNTFYPLTVSKQPQLYKKETDSVVVKELNFIFLSNVN